VIVDGHETLLNNMIESSSVRDGTVCACAGHSDTLTIDTCSRITNLKILTKRNASARSLRNSDDDDNSTVQHVVKQQHKVANNQLRATDVTDDDDNGQSDVNEHHVILVQQSTVPETYRDNHRGDTVVSWVQCVLVVVSELYCSDSSTC